MYEKRLIDVILNLLLILRPSVQNGLPSSRQFQKESGSLSVWRLPEAGKMLIFFLSPLHAAFAVRS